MNEEHTPEEEMEEQLQEEAAAGEGMVPTPDDLPKAHLTLMADGQATEEVFEIRGHAVIGRHDEAVGPVDVDLAPIDESKFISRRHAEIRNDEGKWLLKDLGSSNGTFIPGENDFEKITDEVELTDGQEIGFGNVRFRFDVVPVEEPVTEEPG